MLRETILRHKKSLTGITKSESQLFYSIKDQYSDSESENNNKSKGEGFPEVQQKKTNSCASGFIETNISNLLLTDQDLVQIDSVQDGQSLANVLLSDAGAQLDLKLEKRNTLARKKIDMKSEQSDQSSEDFFDTMDHY